MKFIKLYNDTITFPKNIPAGGIENTLNVSIHSDYYALLEKNYKPVKSTENISDCSWLDVSLIVDNDEYNKLIVTRADENDSFDSRKTCIEFTLDKVEGLDPSAARMIKECNSIYAWFIQDGKETIIKKLNVYGAKTYNDSIDPSIDTEQKFKSKNV